MKRTPVCMVEPVTVRPQYILEKLVSDDVDRDCRDPITHPVTEFPAE